MASLQEMLMRTQLWAGIRDRLPTGLRLRLRGFYLRSRTIIRHRQWLVRSVSLLSNWWIYWIDALGIVRHRNICFCLKDGTRVWLRAGTNDRFIFEEIFFVQCYAPGLPTDARVIFDVGAQAGMCALFLAKRFPTATIHAFEPMPQNYSLLCKNILTNNLQDRVIPHHLALSDTKEGVTIYESIHNMGGHSMVVHTEDQQAVFVPSDTLDGFCAAHSIGRIDLIKMDVEGAEYPIWYATSTERLQYIQRIVMEWHEVSAIPRYTGAALEQFFSDHHFHVRRDEDFLFASRSHA